MIIVLTFDGLREILKMPEHIKITEVHVEEADSTHEDRLTIYADNPPEWRMP